MALNIRPVGDRIIVELIEVEEEKKGGIIIPDAAKEKSLDAIVVAVGPGLRDREGHLISHGLKKGDRVFTSKYGGTELTVEGKSYRIFGPDDILAVYE